MKEIDFEAIRQTAFENCTKHFDDDDLSKAVVLQAKLASVIAKEMLIEYHRQISASESAFLLTRLRQPKYFAVLVPLIQGRQFLLPRLR